MGLILDDPFNGLAFAELHGVSQSGGEVDVPLFAGLTLNELDFGGVAHESLLVN
jgi:hypothetical protein